MEKVYKHKKTGQIAYYKDGVFKQNNCSVEIGVEPSSEFWNEVLFITEDGVEMFEGGIYFVPQRKGKKYKGYLSFSAAENYVYHSEVKRFSSKQKMLEFIKDFNKEPILTTFDGVELFDQDVYYFIWLNKPAHGQEVNKIYKAIVRPLEGDASWSSDAVFFSTKESAEKYLKENQKQFSISDIVNFVNNIPEGRINADDVINFFNLWDK